MRIKLFENFKKLLSREEIESSLVDLRDLGFTLTIEFEDTNCYEVTITNNSKEADPFFSITEVIEPIYILTSFLQEKFGNRFDYTFRYYDGNYENDYEYINFLEDYLDSDELINYLDDEVGLTDKVVLKLEIK